MAGVGGRGNRSRLRRIYTGGYPRFAFASLLLLYYSLLIYHITSHLPHHIASHLTFSLFYSSLRDIESIQLLNALSLSLSLSLYYNLQQVILGNRRNMTELIAELAELGIEEDKGG
jgi:hypothetical protein